MDLKSWLKAEKGRMKALSVRLGVADSRVSQMAADGCVPIRHIAAVVEFSGGEVTRAELLNAYVAHSLRATT